MAPDAVLGKIINVSRLKVDVLVNEEEVSGLKQTGSAIVTTNIYPGVIFWDQVSRAFK